MNPAMMTLMRALIIAAGASLVTKGIVSQDQLGSGADLLLNAGGAAVVLVGWGLGIYHNWQVKHALAVSAVKGTPIVVPVIGKPTVANATPSQTASADIAKAKAA